MNNILKILIISIAFISCKNEYAFQAEEICKCLKKSERVLAADNLDRKKSVVNECLKKEIEANAAEDIGEKRLNALFERSMKLSQELKKDCGIFQKHQDEIVRLLKKGDEKSTSKKETVQSSTEVKGQIISIKQLDEHNSEFELRCIDGKLFTFFYKSIPSNYQDKTVSVSYEERRIDEELILWVQKLEVTD